MTLRATALATLLLVLLPLAACKKDDASAAPTDAATPAATPAQGNATSEMVAQMDAAAESSAASITAAAMSGPPLVAGTDYVEIQNGQPYAPLDGKVEVVEVFGYVCPACARFQPLVSAWKKKLPPNVRFTYVPAPFGGPWIPYARAYYVAEQTPGLLDKTHDALFHAIHLEQTLKGERGQDSDADIAAFYAKYGANPQEFIATMNSFAINTKVNKAKQFIERSFVGDTPSTPTVIVNGKYRIKGASYEDILRITTRLIAEQGTAAPAAPAAPDAPAAPAAPTPAQ